MTPFRFVPPAALLVLLLLGAAVPGAAQDLVIAHVGVVDVRTGTLLPDRTVVIADGRVARVEPDGAAPAGAEVLDGAGMYLIPGLIDAHVHLRHPMAPTILMPQFVANGVTGVREMASECDGPEQGPVCLEQMQEWRARIDAGEMVGPRLLSLSSFPLNPPWDYHVTEEQARGIVREMDRRGVDLIKMYYRMAPEPFAWVIDEATKLGLPVSGHIPLRMTSEAASNAGLHSLEHARDFLFDCFPGTAEFRATTRSQDPPVDVMRSMVDDHDPARCAEIYATFVRNGTWWVPTLVTRRMDARADDPAFRDDPRRKYLPAALWAEWQADADRMVALDPSPEGRRVMRGFYETAVETVRRAHAAGVRIALGTDAPDTYVFPGSGAHDELAELVKAGFTPAEALAAATIRAAELIGVEAEYGTVEPGKRADLVLLSANPLDDVANSRTIEAVILGGRVHDRADLDAMLRGVEAAAAAWTE